MHISTRTKIY